MNSETKICQNCKQNFTVEPEDFDFYKKINVPPPTLCPDCRYQRRIANRNEWNFYKRTCSLCGVSMVSLYNSFYPGPVYCQPCYWSDKWNSFDYGRDFDFSRPFFEQFYEHRYKVPRIALANEGSINSEYTNQSNNNKNCYMTVATNACEYCMYGNWNQKSKECVDCWMVNECELLYGSIDCLRCYRSYFLETCNSVNNSYFCNACRGCNNCFGCVGLRSKSYCWFNEQLTKEEYERRFNEIEWTTATIEGFWKKLNELRNKLPIKYYHGPPRIENCSGDFIGFSKNMHYAFNCHHCENFSYGQDAWEARDCRDLTETLDNELEYELEGVGWSHGSIASCKQWYGSNVAYSELSFHSDNLLGCVSMIKKNYCIFNKQYSPEEWKVMKKKIMEHMKKTGEWGEFFPISISPFPYNDSLAQDYFPLSREKIIANGWRWHARDVRDYKISLNHIDLPSTISVASDEILKEVISCATQDSKNDKRTHLTCATAFRIHPTELEFYRKMNLPIPHKCFPCRLYERLGRRNPRKLWKRQCQCAGAVSENSVYKSVAAHSHGEARCPNEFETSYAPERPEIVYCEQCYNAEVA